MASAARSLLLGSLLLAACGGEAKPHAAFPQGGDAPPAEPAPQKPVVIKDLKRADVKVAIQRGPGYFLQNVALDENVVMINGKFHGWVLRGINENWILDLNPGDVITRINGIVPEKPDDAVTALQSLEKAKSLKVEYEREGKPRTLELPIVE